jgi:hypothetical protein
MAKPQHAKKGQPQQLPHDEPIDRGFTNCPGCEKRLGKKTVCKRQHEFRGIE